MSKPIVVPRYLPLALVLLIFVIVPATLLPGAASAASAPQPNLLLIITDQQHAGMLRCTGNAWLQTPALDSLAARGIRFERAYAANPVCIPSRVSMFTGRMPSYFGMRSNAEGRNQVPPETLRQCLGSLLRRAGYETVYGGKTHWLRGMTPESIGFQPLTSDQRGELAAACEQFLKSPREKPFLLVASFINPHDICYMAIDDWTRNAKQAVMYPKSTVERQCLAEALRMPAGVSRDEFFQRLCPPLPANYEVPALEPECIATSYVGERSFRKFARENWSDQQWRLHRWAYCRLTEMVDAHIGHVLGALRESGLEDETIVLFTSDHGDLDAAHRLEHKSIPYEEAARVPLLIAGPGVGPAGSVDDRHLISVGLDLLPTLCDLAGAEPPADLSGSSLRPLWAGEPVAAWREQIVVESQAGRTLRTARYKYSVFESGAHREQLIDVQEDPGEMANLAEDARYQDILQEHRQRLRGWVQTTGDDFGQTLLPAAAEQAARD